MSIHFIGVDAGGTSTRAMLATASGEVVGTGHAAGANSWSSGTPVADTVTEAITMALGSVETGSVVGGVVAMAGGGAESPEIAAQIGARWRSLGLGGLPSTALDVLAAYCAGTTEREGVVLAAGTGAIAAWVTDGDIERRAGGHGYLVGDEGSAVWLATGAIQATLRALDGRGPSTALAGTVLEALEIEAGDDEAQAGQIVTATYGQPPARLGSLAPGVIATAEAGDAVARDLVDRAAAELEGIALAASNGRTPRVVVLAGSLLTAAAPIRDRVRRGLTDRWPQSGLTQAASGEAGAVALAITRHTGEPIGHDVLERLRG